MTPKPGYAQLSYYQRLILKELLDRNISKVEIAERLGVSRGTVFNELKRGTVNEEYDPEYAEMKAQMKNRNGGMKSIIGQDIRLAEYISKLILKEKLSPERIVEHLKRNEDTHGFEKYPTTAGTIYTAVEQGMIPNVTKKDLPSGTNTEIITMYSDGICFPAWVREQLKLTNGDKFRIECKKNGSIVLKKIRG